MRKDKTELRKKRKLSEDENYELASKCLKTWNELRQAQTEKLRKEQLIDQLLKMLKGNMKSFVRKHDTVRIMQSIIQHGTVEQRSVVFEELKDSIVELSKMKFSKFYIIKMCKYGTAQQKQFIIRSFYGHVKVLLRHAIGSSVLETVYNEMANAQQRSELVQEYYGPEFSLFKDEKTVYLKSALEKMDESKAKQVLAHLKDELNELCNKQSLKMSISHFLFREFFKNASIQDKNELAQSLADKVAEILHTKDGSRVALQCIWNVGAKERKVMVKSFKKLVASIAKEEQGHYVLMGLFDAMDDTKLLEKSIIEELFDEGQIGDLLQNEYACKVMMYLLCPRDSRFFHPDVVSILAEGDNNPFSKKDQIVRQQEVRQAALPHFLKLIENNFDLLFKGDSAILLLETLEKVDSDRYAQAAITFANYLLDCGVLKDGDKKHPLFQGKTEFVIKRLIKFERSSFSTESESPPRTQFSQQLSEQMSDEILRSYINCQRGCFILLLLLETEIPSVIQNLRIKLHPFEGEIFKSDSKGSELLYNKLNSKMEV